MRSSFQVKQLLLFCFTAIHAIAAGVRPEDTQILGRTADYEIAYSSSDVVVRYFGRGGTETLRWGGEGEDVPTSFAFQAETGVLLVGGYRKSTTVSGGDIDGFVLEISRGALRSATLVGGTGTDRVLAVRFAGVAITYAGDSTSATINGASTTRLGPGGYRDALLGRMDLSGHRALLVGAEGDNSATALAATADEYRVAAGGEGWTALVDWSPAAPVLAWTVPQGAVALHFQAPNALFLLGAENGDALLARLSAATGEVAFRRPLGGSGVDEPLSLTGLGRDLLVTGATTSKDFPGAREPLAGATDGFLALLDSDGRLLYASLWGGEGDDRLVSAVPEPAGRIYLAGYSASPAWLAKLDPLYPAERAPFSTLLTLPRIEPEPLTVGHNLIGPLRFRAYVADDSAGLVTVRSLDPTRALLSLNPRGTGEAQLTLANAETTVYVHALAADGMAEIVFSGAGLIERRHRVKLAPSAQPGDLSRSFSLRLLSAGTTFITLTPPAPLGFPAQIP